MPHLQVNQEHIKRSKEGSRWRLVMTVTLLNIISKINIFTFPISGDPFLFMLFNPTSWLLTMLLKLLWQLLTNSGCWKGFYFGISLTWWHFCQLAWLKAWIIHAWAVTGMIMFLHADRKPFRKFYYIVTWWITTAILLGDFFFLPPAMIYITLYRIDTTLNWVNGALVLMGISPGLLSLFIIWLHVTWFHNLSSTLCYLSVVLVLALQ